MCACAAAHYDRGACVSSTLPRVAQVNSRTQPTQPQSERAKDRTRHQPQIQFTGVHMRMQSSSLHAHAYVVAPYRCVVYIPRRMCVVFFVCAMIPVRILDFLSGPKAEFFRDRMPARPCNGQHSVKCICGGLREALRSMIAHKNAARRSCAVAWFGHQHAIAFGFVCVCVEIESWMLQYSMVLLRSLWNWSQSAATN